ncbi:MAG: transposase, partial [Sulfitobacter sp.]|nr:transposase [Sulfitobacter sp.]
MATLAVGEFQAVETQKRCKHCQAIYRSEELRALTPQGGKFGFDVIEYVGRALFIGCRAEPQIRSELAARNVAISENEIGFLGKRFMVYLMLAHRECHEALKHHMEVSGGYILHMDGTCEGDSPHLFSCIDGLSNIVLGNRKMPTEDSQYIVPLLQQLKSDYGMPIGCVHDMGNAIGKSVKQVFPGIADFICHFHFLRDLGKDLFDFEYRTIRRYTRAYNVQAKLKKCAKQLKSIIDEAPPLSDSLAGYLSNRSIQCGSEDLD